MIPILDSVQWQMHAGERAVLEGVLSQLRPGLAVEIGTAEGGSLSCIARHAERVLSFDLVAPPIDLGELPNVSLHTGDSHFLLPQVLTELGKEGLNVDFVLVDGDHTAAGVEQDARDLLASEAIRSTVVLFHDTMNDEVRAGLERIDVSAEPKIAYFDLEFVTGRLNYGGRFHHQLWGGFGLMVIDVDLGPSHAGDNGGTGYTLFELLAPVRDVLVVQERAGGLQGPGRVRDALAANSRHLSEVADLRDELARAQLRYEEIRNSKSWRFTAPLRSVRKHLHRRA